VRFLLYIFIGLILFTSCTDSQPDNLLEEDVYESIFIELAIIDQLEATLLGEYTRRELRQMVYDHYGVTAEDFAETHAFYEQNIEKQLERVDRINERMRSERFDIDESEREFRTQNRRSAESLRDQIFNSSDLPTDGDMPENEFPDFDSDVSAELPVTSQIDSSEYLDVEDFPFSQNGRFSIQVRSLRDLTIAEQILDEWIEKGFESAYLTEFQHDETGETWYRIRLGNVNSVMESERIQKAVYDIYDTEVWITNRDD